MPVKDEHITLSKNVATADDMDFQFLREKGLEYIRQIAHDLWTDYNVHDPGITILDVLSYAITDLAMRIDLPMEDLLTGGTGPADGFKDQFFTAEQILPSRPVTVTDYRKLFIDIEGVKNCWLQPFEKRVFVDCEKNRLGYKPFENEHEKKEFTLKGLYRILVETEDAQDEPDSAGFEKIKQEIEKVYHANRNLCEDLVEVSEVETQPVSVCARIDVEPEADEEMVHAKVIRALKNYFSPSVRFYSLKQMLGKGYSVDEIFEGPLLKNGFIDTGELEKADLRKEIRLSDIVRILMNIEGVNVIKEITISGCGANRDVKEHDQWLIRIDDGKKPVLCSESAFSYYKGVLPVNINSTKVEEYIKELDAAEKSMQHFSADDMTVDIPQGTYLDISDTTTIQNDLPENYGISEAGLPDSAETSRKSKARQLKGYLLFFDQILASYFAHLGKVKGLLSVNSELKHTYFTQAVKDIKDFEVIVKDYDMDDPDRLTSELFEKFDNRTERRNILLDHLIARFAENISEYAFLMNKLYGNYASQAVVNSKRIFLSEYGDVYAPDGSFVKEGISNRRGGAFNYFKQKPESIWDTENVSGVQQRIARLAGIKDYRRHNLSDSFAEVYMITDSDGKDVYRWRIRNDEDEILVSSTENYDTVREAEAELYLTILKIVDTDEDVVLGAFESAVTDEQEIGNFEIQISPEGKYSFDVINRDAPEYSAKHVIARQFTYYTTATELRDAILRLIRFTVSTFSEEGMFVVEHILLRPDVSRTDVPHNQFMPVCTGGCNDCQPVDPYSYRVTVVLPGWTYRFSDPDFRRFMEELIRREMPAHILARVCWIGDRMVTPENDTIPEKTEMELFETAYKEFLLAKTKAGQGQNSVKQRKFIRILSKLNSVYPAGSLIDCEDEEDSLEDKIILGSTHIGNL